MSSASLTRSQVILRLPVENVNADLVLHDGERAAVMLFVPAGEDVSRVVTGAEPFVPVVRAGRVVLVARAAIACLAVAARHAAAVPHADDLPRERQRVAVRLRAGAVIEGELAWVAEAGRMRTTDHLNAAAPYIAVADGATTYLIAKAHIATVAEL